MSTSDGSGTGEPNTLGEKLLSLISSDGSKKRKLQPSRATISYLLRSGGGDSFSRLVFIAVLAALCGTGVLLLLNAEADEIEKHSYSALVAVFFVALLIVYRVSQNLLISNAAEAIETALDQKRQRVVEDVLQLSLRDIEQIERSRLRDGIAANYGALSQTLVPIIAGAEALILLAFMFAYVLSLSLFAAGLAVIVVSLTVIGYLNRSKEMEIELAAANAADARFRALTDAVAEGAKELQLSLQRRSGLMKAMQASSSALARGRSASAAHFADLISTGTTISYLMAGAVVFVMPLITDHGDDDISRIVVAVIFLLGPIGSVVQTVQQFATAQNALGAINRFEADVSERKATTTDLSQPAFEKLRETVALTVAFDNITLGSVGYVHRGEQGFAIESINLTLSKREIVFLTGGNGSGKTTLLRVLTGLYPRTSGSLHLNGHPVAAMPSQGYRELFAGVFGDFHLFDQPFGLDDAGISRFSDGLEQLGIRNKLGDDLTNLVTDHLSTGQRKRVALALALAEARPILVLDEWAADQDPETRRRFYEEILPGLREKGCCVFAITHDEQYFHLCDRRLHMVEGRLAPGGSK